MDLVSYIENKFSISLIGSQRLAEIMTVTHIEKGQCFVKNGKVNKMEYFICEGVCRSFLINTSGIDVTLSFYTPGNPVSPNVTRTAMFESFLNVETLTDTKLLVFANEDLMNLMRDHREIETWANNALQAELFKKVAKEINQNSMNAKERLIDFRERYPALENEITHSYISSYLGITNVTLSRIRKEISGN